MTARVCTILAGVILIAALAGWTICSPGAERVVGSYTTSLNGRTDSQIHNVRLAARQVNNTVLMPGQTFSFVRKVGPWTADRGYKKAPVSYDGELLRSWGGGVCQASSTLYNAALLAGLDIVERHRHHWPARYAPLGRDAAVAYENIDLKFRNNLPEPVRIVGSVEGTCVTFKLLSRHKPGYKVQVGTDVRQVTHPSEVIQNRADGAGRWKLINKGHAGFYVVTVRRFVFADKTRQQIISRDNYPAMNKIYRIVERGG